MCLPVPLTTSCGKCPMVTSEAKATFDEACREIECLLELAEKLQDSNSPSGLSVMVLNKSALILLCAKLECFCESLAEEYVFRVNEAVHLAAHIPQPLLLRHTKKIVDAALISRNPSAYAETMREVARLWTECCKAPAVTPDIRMSFGKHGSKELRRLFESVGAQMAVDEFVVDSESMIEGNTKPFRAEVDSLTAIRNSILHSDASPSFAIADVERRVELFKKFAEFADSVVMNMIADVADRALDSSPLFVPLD